MKHSTTIVHERWIIRRLYHRTGDPAWRALVRDRRTGRLHWFTTHETDCTHAGLRVLAWIAEREAEEHRTPSVNTNFQAAFAEWLTLKDVRPSTEADYKRNFEKVYIKDFDRRPVADIRMADIERFLALRRTLSARTKRKYLTELRGFFAWAVRHRYCPENPCDGIKVPRGPKRQGTALTLEEAKVLLRAAEGVDHLWLALLIALHTGLRRGNILHLRLRHVDLGRPAIILPAEEMKANANHVVPLHLELLRVLRQRLYGRDHHDPDEFVLGRELGQITRSFQGALRRAGIRRIRWHDLRHTAATWWSTRCSYAVLRQLLGHSPGAVTLHYTHVPFEELRQVVFGMPNLLSGGAPAPAANGAGPWGG